jgi:hypothetical protein
LSQIRTGDVLDAYHDRLVEAGAQHYRQVEPVSFQVRNSGVNHAMHRKVEKWLEAAQLQEV